MSSISFDGDLHKRSSSGPTNAAVIAVPVVCGVLILALIGGWIFIWIRRRNQKLNSPSKTLPQFTEKGTRALTTRSSLKKLEPVSFTAATAWSFPKHHRKSESWQGLDSASTESPMYVTYPLPKEGSIDSHSESHDSKYKSSSTLAPITPPAISVTPPAKGRVVYHPSNPVTSDHLGVSRHQPSRSLDNSNTIFSFWDPRSEDASSNDFDSIHTVTPSSANQSRVKDSKRASDSSASMYSTTTGVTFSQDSHRPPLPLRELPPIGSDSTFFGDEDFVAPSENPPVHLGRANTRTISTLLHARANRASSVVSTTESGDFVINAGGRDTRGRSRDSSNRFSSHSETTSALGRKPALARSLKARDSASSTPPSLTSPDSMSHLLFENSREPSPARSLSQRYPSPPLISGSRERASPGLSISDQIFNVTPLAIPGSQVTLTVPTDFEDNRSFVSTTTTASELAALDDLATTMPLNPIRTSRHMD